MTTFSEVYAAFEPYRDKYGLNQLNTEGGQGGTTQNGALFTMEYLLCLVTLHPDTIGTAEEIERIRDVYNALEMLPGLTRRYPGDGEGDSMDNNGASLVFSKLFGYGDFARRMWYRGQARALGVDMEQDPVRNMKFYPIAWLLNGFKAPRYFWNNTRPTEFCIWGWYGRSPGFLAVARLCAEDKMSFFGGLSIWVGQFLGCFSKPENTDGRKLPYITWQILKDRNWFWKMSYRLWCFILMRQYPRGMQDVYRMYYNDPNHPLPLYSPAYRK